MAESSGEGQGAAAPGSSNSPKLKLIHEGKAQVEVSAANEVFYNPAQVVNRDLSVICIKAYHQLRWRQLQANKANKKTRGTKRKAVGSDGPLPDQDGASPAVPPQDESSAAPVDTEQHNGTGDAHGSRAQPPAAAFRGLVDVPESHRLTVLEPLSASGLRGLRYLLELPHCVRHVIANDIDPKAADTIRHNRHINNISPDQMHVECEDASVLMYMWKRRGQQQGKGNGADNLDIIDIDPYGSASPFLDAAVQAVKDGGMLCVTSTDMPVLAGNTPEVTFSRYGGTALKARYVHEMALRLVLHAIRTSAGRYKRSVVPLASFSIDFYVRVFVQIRNSSAETKNICKETGLVFQCVQCDTFHVVPLGETVPSKNPQGPDRFKAPHMPTHIGGTCGECGGRYTIGGPAYMGPLYQEEFVSLCLEVCKAADADDSDTLDGLTQTPRIKGMLGAVQQEWFDLPLFYHLPSLCAKIKLQVIPLKAFKSALLHLGYRVSHFHREPQAIKTDAPPTVVHDLIRSWAKEHPPKNTKHALLQKDIMTEGIDFSLHKDVSTLMGSCIREDRDASSQAQPRWMPNPQPFWGPQKKARSSRG
ncbi:unnamed protein product [Vitrella brassicaformis CCMP3155]|uniref:tRNA (guanine(26)-N(2))-dimethyltransferase n=2 Tax=Vitrella brassicaformis TaxID=1169539 RepID=A0A0G4FD85_VITBC|nr:unnamed protein product [Vitrella brassicaformis CCMP3155]|mmetsp:Transcript_5622/g.15725  ORF Transcript_5622/g.15725 Transcript_5622/m.15725 type:complete len:589 (+) Transcript_5622:49-1815(+)|eukprot:CEM11212.1 unnamed protein product [Vitrella brassicaformis CCMP3155]